MPSKLHPCNRAKVIGSDVELRTKIYRSHSVTSVNRKTLNDDELIRLLSSGDVVPNELFYHKEEVKCCLAKYHTLYYLQRKKEMGDSSVNKFEYDWWEITSFNKLKYYIFCKVRKNLEPYSFLRNYSSLYRDAEKFGHEERKSCHQIF